MSRQLFESAATVIVIAGVVSAGAYARQPQTGDTYTVRLETDLPDGDIADGICSTVETSPQTRIRQILRPVRFAPPFRPRIVMRTRTPSRSP